MIFSKVCFFHIKRRNGRKHTRAAAYKDKSIDAYHIRVVMHKSINLRFVWVGTQIDEVLCFRQWKMMEKLNFPLECCEAKKDTFFSFFQRPSKRFMHVTPINDSICVGFSTLRCFVAINFAQFLNKSTQGTQTQFALDFHFVFALWMRKFIDFLKWNQNQVRDLPFDSRWFLENVFSSIQLWLAKYSVLKWNIHYKL